MRGAPGWVEMRKERCAPSHLPCLRLDPRHRPAHRPNDDTPHGAPRDPSVVHTCGGEARVAHPDAAADDEPFARAHERRARRAVVPSHRREFWAQLARGRADAVPRGQRDAALLLVLLRVRRHLSRRAAPLKLRLELVLRRGATRPVRAGRAVRAVTSSRGRGAGTSTASLPTCTTSAETHSISCARQIPARVTSAASTSGADGTPPLPSLAVLVSTVLVARMPCTTP